MPITRTNGIVIVISASLPSGIAVDRALPGLPFLAAAPPGTGNAFPASGFGAVARDIGSGDGFASPAHSSLPVSSFADSDREAG
jgi:hypothetical protein